jgi:hypothetical protein
MLMSARPRQGGYVYQGLWCDVGAVERQERL